MSSDEGSSSSYLPAGPAKVSAGELVRNGDPNIPLNRSQGATILMIVAAGLSFLFVVATFIFDIFALAFVYWPVALCLQIFWIFQILETGIAFASAISAGYGKVVQRLVLLDIVGMVISAFGLLTIWVGFGISVVFYYNCLTSSGSLSESEDLMCEDEWVLGITWWGGLILLTILSIVTFVAHIYSFATTQIPNVLGIISSGNFAITGKIKHRAHTQSTRKYQRDTV